MPSLPIRLSVVLTGLLTATLAVASATTAHGETLASAALVSLAVLVALIEAATLLALAIAMLRPTSRVTRLPRPVSVLIAAWNERDGIVDTVRDVLAQRGIELEVIVADDGSTDGTEAEVKSAFQDDGRVRSVRIDHAGKGAALEAARALARYPRIATIDADTRLEPDALAKLVGAIDGDVVAAGGAVLIAHARSLGERFQSLEYLRTTWVRAAWARLGMLEQIPGAFSAFDSAALEAAGGFPIDSITEDYEVSYRLYDHAGARPMQIALVPEARAFTAPPDDLLGFVRQRTRWFAGFLSTLSRFRRLIFAKRTGRFGMLRLPLKVLDAVGPLLAASATLSLALLVAQGEALSLLVLLPLVVRALGDLAIFAAARAMAPGHGRGALALCLTALDALTYGVFRQAVVLRAYPFAARRVATWERSRSSGATSIAIEHDPAPAE